MQTFLWLLSSPEQLVYSSSNSIHHPLICLIKDSQIQLSSKSKSEMKEHLNRPGSRSNIKWTTLSWYLPRSQKFNVFRNTESKKLRIEKPLTGEILRSMKCEVKPLLTRSSGSTQEMKGSTESNDRYQTQTRKLVFPGVNKKKATPPNHIQT